MRERLVCMVAEIHPNYPTEWAVMKAAETVYTWARRAQVYTAKSRRPSTRSLRDKGHDEHRTEKSRFLLCTGTGRRWTL